MKVSHIGGTIVSDSLLTQILNELTEIKTDIKEIKAKTDEIPSIKQAVLETNQRTVIIEGYTKQYYPVNLNKISFLKPLLYVL